MEFEGKDNLLGCNDHLDTDGRDGHVELHSESN